MQERGTCDEQRGTRSTARGDRVGTLGRRLRRRGHREGSRGATPPLRPTRWVVLALATALPLGCGESSAPPSDASAATPDVDQRPEGCGEVPRGYACEGGLLRYCEDGLAASLDCARYTDDAGVCREISPNHGSYCVVPVGGACRMAVPHGSHDHIHYAHCEGARAGCLLSVVGGVNLTGRCVEGAAPCTAATASRCDGDRLVVRCERGQPVAYDCESYGGRCDPTLLACVGVAEGRRCGASFLCAPGLSCRAVTGMRGVNACQR